jgi:D-3-phosphoglycerate dehydrogenase
MSVAPLRILLTHTPRALERYYGAEALAALRALGTVTLNPGETPLTTAELIEHARDCDVIVSDRLTPGEGALFAGLPRLAAFVRCAMDIRNIDLAAASAAGVVVTRATPGFGDSAAELALGLIIDLARGISAGVGAYRMGQEPEIRMGVQLSTTTLGIVGYGTIGRRVASRAAAFGMKVLAHDPFRTDFDAGVESMSLPDLLAASRFVICLAPANETTRHLFDAGAFAGMAKGAYFINLSRGDLVDEAALAAALDSGHLAGAALDVGSAPDQMPAPLLRSRRDVIATPHIGGLTPEAVKHQAMDTVRQVAAVAEGRIPDLAANPGAATRLALRRISAAAINGAA